MTRAEKVAEAQRLRAEGLSVREIAERMGVGRSTASTWLADPDLAKQRARRERYVGRCEDCGGNTDGSNGKANAPTRCYECTNTRNAERNARILAAWERGDTGRQIAAREGISYQSVAGVIEHRRRRKGEPVSLHRRRNRDLWPEIERRYRDGESPTQIAAALGLRSLENVTTMLAEMRRAGIDIPYQRPWQAGPRRAAA